MQILESRCGFLRLNWKVKPAYIGAIPKIYISVTQPSLCVTHPSFQKIFKKIPFNNAVVLQFLGKHCQLVENTIGSYIIDARTKLNIPCKCLVLNPFNVKQGFASLECIKKSGEVG